MHIGRMVRAFAALSVASALTAGSAYAAEIDIPPTGVEDVSFTIDAGPSNPVCQATVQAPAQLVQGPRNPTGRVGHEGRGTASCGVPISLIELYGILQYSSDPAFPTAENLDVTEFNDFDDKATLVEPFLPSGSRVGYLRTRVVARFNFQFAVTANQVRKGCAKTGPATIVCVAWSGPVAVGPSLEDVGG